MREKGHEMSNQLRVQNLRSRQGNERATRQRRVDVLAPERDELRQKACTRGVG